MTLMIWKKAFALGSGSSRFLVGGSMIQIYDAALRKKLN